MLDQHISELEGLVEALTTPSVCSALLHKISIIKEAIEDERLEALVAEEGRDL